MKLSVLLQNAPNGGVSFFLPMLLILLVVYFFMIRPQINRHKEDEKFQSGLKKGDKIITIGGIHGKVHGVKEDKVIIEISENIKITINKNAVSRDNTTEFNSLKK
tara:strand:+ start:2260 stop:2574 length:315 start_codon:yes stop_codon:yes gene_type:complete